jgi:hypothetical protein
MGSRLAIDGRRARRELSRPALVTFGLVLVVLVAHATSGALGAGLATLPLAPRPAEALLRLVPPDSALVLTIEGLRDHTSAFLKSRLAADLKQLPAVRAGLESEKYKQFERSRARIETLLGANLTDLRDELLGDAVVLALRLPPDAPADNHQARGILLVQARDLALLRRLIRVVNTIQQESGELAGVAERQRNGTTYQVREFPPAANRPSECYVVYPDGTFAFTNSEALIQSVIDRKNQSEAGKVGAQAGPKPVPGLGELPRLRAVDSRLPAPVLARLFVDPRHFERLMAATPRPSKPTDVRLMALLERYLAAVDYAGAALTWNDGAIVVHTVETLNPSLLPWPSPPAISMPSPCSTHFLRSSPTTTSPGWPTSRPCSPVYCSDKTCAPGSCPGWGRASSRILTHPRKRRSRGARQARSRPLSRVGPSRW